MLHFFLIFCRVADFLFENYILIPVHMQCSDHLALTYLCKSTKKAADSELSCFLIIIYVPMVRMLHIKRV